MTRVIAAIDNSLAAEPVLATADAVAHLFAASLEAVHVPQNGHATADQEAEKAGLSLRLLTGAITDALIGAAQPDDVDALVVGARSTPAGARPAGRTALDLIGSLSKPLVIVPPGARRPSRMERVLLPLEGTTESSLAPATVFEIAQDAAIDVVVLHVHDDASIPLFTDQPQHETQAWMEEFLARYCPRGLRSVRLELRVGRPEEQVVRVAEESDIDMIALGWNQQLRPGRAAVVREVLARCPIPVLLIPVAPLDALRNQP